MLMYTDIVDERLDSPGCNAFKLFLFGSINLDRCTYHINIHCSALMPEEGTGVKINEFKYANSLPSLMIQP